MIDILLLAIGWGLIGICIAWVIGGVSGHEVTKHSHDGPRLVLLEGGNQKSGRTGGNLAGASARKARISELQFLVTAARQSGCNEFADDILYRPSLCKRSERC